MTDDYRIAARLALGATLYGGIPGFTPRSRRAKTQRGMRLERNRKTKAAKKARRKNRRS